MLKVRWTICVIKGWVKLKWRGFANSIIKAFKQAEIEGEWQKLLQRWCTVISACGLLTDCRGFSCFIFAVTGGATGAEKFLFMSCSWFGSRIPANTSQCCVNKPGCNNARFGKKCLRIAKGMLRWLTAFWFSSQVGTGSSPLAGEGVCPS